MKTNLKSYLDSNPFEVMTVGTKEMISAPNDVLESNAAVKLDFENLKNEKLKAYDKRNQKISDGINAQYNML